MKRFMILGLVLLLGACHHSMDPWPSDSDRQDVAMYFRTRSLSGITSLPPVYQFFILDKASNTVKSYSVNATNENAQLRLQLFPGSYTGYCITNANDQSNWEFSENSTPEQIYLKLKGEAKDFCLGMTDFEVTASGGTATFDLTRKVGMLKIIIENIPEWLTDLQINLSGLQEKMNLSGDYAGQYNFTKDITPPDANGTSETSVLVFPPQGQANLTLSSNSLVFITPVHTIAAIKANHITEIKAIFHGETNKPEIDIIAEHMDWDEQTLYDPDWNIDLPKGPCEGTGNGYNLVSNAGFENGFTDNIPTGWKLDNGGASKCVVQATSPVFEGNYAVRLEGKTYLYQDIPITGGACYQLKMFVNAANDNIRWRYWCTWMQGSTNLNSDAIRTSTYQNKTNGYTDVFAGQIFRAPANATKLRMEIRTYMERKEGEGLYVDAVAVEPVN